MIYFMSKFCSSLAHVKITMTRFDKHKQNSFKNKTQFNFITAILADN